MAAPSGTWQRPDLGVYFQALDLAAMRQGFIGLSIAKMFPVALQSANFSRIRQRDLLQRRHTLRAPGAGYALQKWNFIQDNYSTNEHGAEETLDRRERKMYAYTGIMQDLIAAERARDVVLREQEIRIAESAFSTTATDVEGLAQGTGAVSKAWSDVNNGTPLDDITSAINAFFDQFGYEPNTVVMNDNLMRAFKTNASVVDRLKFSGVDDPKALGVKTIVDFFATSGIKQVLVGKGRYNSGSEGAAVTFSKIWSTDKCLVSRVAETLDPREPCIMRCFMWTEDGSSEGGTIEQYPWEPDRSDRIRCRIDVHEKLLHAKAGYILTNCNGGAA